MEAIYDRTPPSGYLNAANTWMDHGDPQSGEDDTLYTTGAQNGKVWRIKEGTPPHQLLLDDTTPDPHGNYHNYGQDVIQNSKGHLFLSNEAWDSPPKSPADVWRICDNLDTDLFCDDGDNCTATNNTGGPDANHDPSQYDADHDGYGSRCDADFNQDGVSGSSDFTIFKACLGDVVGEGAGLPDDPTCAESDLNGDGAVGSADFSMFKSLFQLPAGPTGLDCAESPPVDDSCLTQP